MANRKNLTDTSVAALEPMPGKYYDVRDAKLPGLCVRVQASGRKSFYFIYSRSSVPRFFRIGPAAMGTAAAKVMARELIGDVARGRDPHAERRAKRGGLTFPQARFVEEHAKKHNKSWKQGEYLVSRFVYPKWAKLLANGITRADVRQLIGSIAAPQTANQVKFAISAVFKFGVKEEVVAANPWQARGRQPDQ